MVQFWHFSVNSEKKKWFPRSFAKYVSPPCVAAPPAWAAALDIFTFFTCAKNREHGRRGIADSTRKSAGADRNLNVRPGCANSAKLLSNDVTEFGAGFNKRQKLARATSVSRSKSFHLPPARTGPTCTPALARTHGHFLFPYSPSLSFQRTRFLWWLEWLVLEMEREERICI